MRVRTKSSALAVSALTPSADHPAGWWPCRRSDACSQPSSRLRHGPSAYRVYASRGLDSFTITSAAQQMILEIVSALFCQMLSSCTVFLKFFPAESIRFLDVGFIINQSPRSTIRCARRKPGLMFGRNRLPRCCRPGATGEFSPGWISKRQRVISWGEIWPAAPNKIELI